MNLNNGSIIVLILVAVVLFVMFRGCRQVEIHQKGDDKRSSIRVDIEKDRRVQDY